MRRIALAAIILVTACTAAPLNLEATVAAAIAMTDTALAPTPSPSATPTAAPTATDTPAPTLTPTQTPVPTRIASAKPITYGQTLSYYPHGESWLYVLDANGGDQFAVSTNFSNLHPDWIWCQKAGAGSASFEVQSIALEPIEPIAGGGGGPSTYLVPETGTYYIAVSCHGACGTCAQVDTNLALAP